MTFGGCTFFPTIFPEYLPGAQNFSQFLRARAKTFSARVLALASSKHFLRARAEKKIKADLLWNIFPNP